MPPLLDGRVGATALTETTGGSDIARCRTSARIIEDGFVLSGSKDHITNGPVADIALVLARVPEFDRRRDITLFLVTADQSGFRRGSHEDLLGLCSSPTGPIWFDNVRLSLNAVLGRVGDGLQTLYNIISFDRALYGLVAAAYLEPRLAEAITFARERTAFGAPIIEHQYVQGRLTSVKIIIETSHAMASQALDYLDAGDESANLMCSIAKLVGSEGLTAAAQDLMCVRGHVGYMQGPWTKTVQDALGTLIAGGTSEMQRKNILNQMLRLAQPDKETQS